MLNLMFIYVSFVSYNIYLTMLLTSLLILLLSVAVTLRRDKSILYSRSSISILIVIFIISTTSYNTSIISTGISLYGGLFHLNSTGQIFQNLIYIISGIIILFTAFYPRKVVNLNNSDKSISESFALSNNDYNDNMLKKVREYISSSSNVRFNMDFITNKKSEQFKIIEYPLILLFVITGATFLISSSDIVSIFICIELQSYGLYLLATLYRNSEISTSAGLTYFLLGGMSSCFILLGTSLLYTNSGSTNLETFYIINNI